jgi:hypothetical protein
MGGSRPSAPAPAPAPAPSTKKAEAPSEALRRKRIAEDRTDIISIGDAEETGATKKLLGN